MMESHGNKSAATTSTKPFYKPGRRPRIPLSCDPCRSRKLKCNREQPCQNCAARAEQAFCKYKGSKNESGFITSPHHEHKHADAMQQRIDRLETLVKTLIAQCQQKSLLEDSPLPNNGVQYRYNPRHETRFDVAAGMSDASTMPHNGGTTVVNEHHSVYKAANDWSDVIQELNALKTIWNQSQDDAADYDVLPSLSETGDGSSFLSSQGPKVEMSELLATLPPKPEVDNLIHQFFDRKNFPIPVAPILHEPTFMQEYAEHWRDPSQTNVIWLGLLFSILGITMLSYHQFDNEPLEYEGTAGQLCEVYRRRTAQCLLTGDIAKCLPYTLETLLLNSTAELAREDDNGRGLWVMTGVIVRTAINMGYHRDPSQTSSISILQGELRRRVWLALVGKDDLASFLVGFPSMMPAIYSDTLEPSNLHDWELSADIAVLPPSRPLAESTPVTYLIVKNRLMRALGRITDFNNSLQPGSYDKILEIDGSLYEVLNEVPRHMKVRGVGEDSDTAQSKSAKTVSMLQMEFLYHLGMCTLHRKFIAKGRVDRKYSLSRDRCLSSALAIIDQQQAWHQETQSKPSGYMPNWYNVAQVRNFFILAAMILCLELEHRRRGANTDAEPDSDVLLHALVEFREIWKDVQDTSDEALRVYQVLTCILLSFEKFPVTGAELVPELPELNQPFQLPNGTPSQDGEDFGTANEMDIDWATWDSFIEGASFEDAYLGISFSDNDLSYTPR